MFVQVILSVVFVLAGILVVVMAFRFRPEVSGALKDAGELGPDLYFWCFCLSLPWINPRSKRSAQDQGGNHWECRLKCLTAG